MAVGGPFAFEDEDVVRQGLAVFHKQREWLIEAANLDRDSE
ncbi:MULTISPECIES: hypothetical protein [Vreelandella]|nr:MULTISPECIES: hypothetical protein [Halomonas]